MKVLVVFIDMLRTDFLNMYNPKLKETPFDVFFKNLNGTLFDNVYTPCPDTGRSLSTFFSGKPCYENGCNKRGKFPGQFLEIPTILDVLKDNDYEIQIFTHRSKVLFPRSFQDDKYFCNSLEDLVIKDDSFSFVDIPDLHHVLDDHGYYKKTIDIAHDQLSKSIKYMFEKIDIEVFDKIIFFSDHGHMVSEDKLIDDYKNEKYIGNSRSRIFFYTRNKQDSEFNINNNLTSLEYFPSYLIENLNLDSKYYFPKNYLENPKKNLEILVEDFMSLKSGINQVPDLWGIKSKKGFFIFDKDQIQTIDLNKINHWPHLVDLRNEYAVFNEYLKFTNKKSNKYRASSFYFNGEKRKPRKKTFIEQSNKFLKAILPPIVYRAIRKVYNLL